MVKGTPVKVTWLDADCAAGWVQFEPVVRLKPEDYLKTYGVYAGEDEFFLHVGFSYNKDSEDFLGTQRIPLGMIHEIKEIDDA